MTKKRLLEMIDACRPGHPDLDDPDLALLADNLRHDEALSARYDRSQRTDEAIGAAVRNVPVPDDARDRLFAALERRTRLRIWTRRGFVAGGIVIAATVLLVLSIAQEPDRVNFNSPHAIAAAVERWDGKLNAAVWWAGETAPTSDLPHYRGLPLPIKRWQWASPNDISCYELFDDKIYGSLCNVRLFVMQQPTKPVKLGPGLPQNAYPSASWTTGAWQSGGCVYVLAVSRDGRPAPGLYKEFYEHLLKRKLLSV